MDKRDERRELIKAMAVASWAEFHNDGGWDTDPWIENAMRDADALLAALDQQSPPTHADIMNAEESPEQSVSEWQERKAAPGGEPNERVCVCADRKPAFDSINGAFVMSTIHNGAPYTGKLFVFCPFCGGKIITEAA